MKRLLLTLALLLVAPGAWAQCNGIFPVNTVCGNFGATPAPPTASTLAAIVGEALTRTNDTNVTVTLGGTPTTALLKATSLTLGWTGTLSVARGGTGLASGTSGGIPYFSGTTTIASSAALTANLPVIGGGAGVAPSVGTRSGNTTAYVTTTGSQTNNDCVKIDSNGNHIASGLSCAALAGVPTTQYLISGTGATYTTPAGARKLIVIIKGGGGGGSGAGAGVGAGGTGGTTTFNSVTAIGGTGGGSSAGAAGGSGGTGSASIRWTGAGGEAAQSGVARSGAGAPGIYGNGGAPGVFGATTNGNAAAANTGAGGSGATAATSAGGAGASGEYVVLEITTPSATYTYTVGAAGAAGAGANTGGAGGTGVIIVQEFY